MRLSGAMIVMLASGTVIVTPAKAVDKSTPGRGSHLPEVPVLVKSLGSSEPRMVSQALILLRRHGPKAAPAVLALRKLLDNKTFAPAAVITLGAIGPDAKYAADAIEKRMSKWKGNHRLQAHGALYFMGYAPEENLGAIIKAIDSDDSDVRDAAVGLVTRIGPPAAKAVPALVEILGAKKDSINSDVAKALGAIGPKAAKAVPALRKYLTAEVRSLRGIAIATIGDIGVADDRTIAALVAIVKKKHFENCYPAARCLGLLGAMGAVRQFVFDKDPALRRFAVVALEHAGGRGVQFLIKLLSDKKKDIASFAGRALGRMKPSPVRELIGALRSRKPGVAALALGALGKIQPPSRAAVRAVMQLHDASVKSAVAGDSLADKCSYTLWLMGSVSRGAGCYMRLFRSGGPMQASRVVKTNQAPGGKTAAAVKKLQEAGLPKRYRELAALVALAKGKSFWMSLAGSIDNSVANHHSWFEGFKESKNTDRKIDQVKKWLSYDWLAFGIDSDGRIQGVRIDVPAFNEWCGKIERAQAPASVGVPERPGAATKPAGRKPATRPSPAAARRFRLAKAYVNSGMPKKAKAILQQIIKDASDPTDVARAKKMLDKLQQEK